MRLLVAANFAQLGLATLAREQLGRLPAGVADDPSLASLRCRLDQLPPDTLAPEDLRRTCRANLQRLADRGPDLREALARWEADLTRWHWFRACDGNIVRRPVPGATGAPGRDRPGEHEAAPWLGLGDHVAFARRFAREKFATVDPAWALIVLEGIDPPWLADEIARRTAEGDNGFRPLLVLVQEDPLEWLSGLAHADLPWLDDARLRVFLGPDAGDALARWLAGRLDYHLVGPVVRSLSVRTPVSPAVEAVMEQARQRQEQEHDRLVREITALYADRDRAWWSQRLAGGTPLRVLIPTTRRSTFVRHASADLAEALRRAGCDVTLMIEPDDSSRFSSLAYLRRLLEDRPEVMIVANHLRAAWLPWLPGGVAYVCWLQDAMPQHFDASLGAAQGSTDFLAGHLHEEMFRHFGFPRDRALAWPVVASATKFHPGPADPDDAARWACDIAMVSHHGETPDDLHARLVTEAGGASSPLGRVLDAVRPEIEALMRRPLAGPLRPALECLVDRMLVRSGCASDRQRTLVLRCYALPLADRILRHETARWAAEMARRRGWRFHLYGRGWERVPDLAEFARGEVEHGEPLRRCYRHAAALLHVSFYTLVHQRVMECALSGGLPLCRLVADHLVAARHLAQYGAAHRQEPTLGDPFARRHGYFVADHPCAIAWVTLLQRLGLEHPAFVWVKEERLRRWRHADAPPPAPEASAVLLPDLGENGFATPARLEELVERAVSRPGWRDAWAHAIARRVRQRFTHDAFARALLDMLRRTLTGDDRAQSQASSPAQETCPLPVTVAVLAAPHGVSGVSSTTAALATLTSSRMRWSPVVAGPHPRNTVVLPEPLRQAPTVSWPASASAVAQVQAVRFCLRQTGARVVCPNFLPQGFAAAALERHRGVRVAALFHGSEVSAEDLYAQAAPLADAWCAVSPAIARRVARYARIPGEVLSGGVRLPDQVSPLPCQSDPGGPLRLLYAGWLDHRVKRVGDLVRLAEALHARGVAFRLSIAGRGPASGWLAEALRAHVQAGRAALLGSVPHAQMSALYQAHDLLVLVSAMEGTPVVVMEAMAHGRPVAITRACGGALAAVRDGIEGVVVEVGATEVLAERLAALSARRDVLGRMAAHARLAAQQHFDLTCLAPRYEALVARALAATPGPDPNHPAELADLWRRVLGVMALIGDAPPREVLGLLLDWLDDVGVRDAVLHVDTGMLAWLDALAHAPAVAAVVLAADATEGAFCSSALPVCAPGDVRGELLGWPVRAPSAVSEGALVVTAAEAHARRQFGPGVHLLPVTMPQVPTLAQRLMTRALDELRRRGCRRIVLYGAGRHTRRIVRSLVATPEIVAIVDDAAGGPGGPPPRLWGLPVVSPEVAARLGFDAVVVSSDEYESAMLPRAQAWAGRRPVIALYGSLHQAGPDIADLVPP